MKRKSFLAFYSFISCVIPILIYQENFITHIHILPGKQCPTVTVQNTNINNATGEYETTLTVQCIAGYRVMEKQNDDTQYTMTCNSDGQWNDTTTCESMLLT